MATAGMTTVGFPIRSDGDPQARGRVGDQRLGRQHQRGDQRARAILIERYLPLATRLAARYARPGEPADDLVQVASMGLIKAVDRWDPDRELAFSSFAVPTILGELRRHFRDHTWDVRPPRAIQEAFIAVEHARDHLQTATGREATVTDLADHLQRPAADVEEALLAAECRRLRSLEDPVHEADDAPSTLGDAVGDTDAGYARAEARATLARLSSVLDERDRMVLSLRFEHGLLQSEIAERVGCSQMHVSRLIRRSLARLALRARLAA